MATTNIRSAIRATTNELAPDLPRGFRLPNDQICFLHLLNAEQLSSHSENTLYNLFDKNMFEMSAGTSMTYTESAKRAELFEPATRFLIAAESNLATASGMASRDKRKGKQEVDVTAEDLLGFCSFRFDTEETMTSRDAEVVYCYELQLVPLARGQGLGKVLMNELEVIGRRRRLDKAMLTCLSNNRTALRFYAMQGYTPDEIDPTRMSEEEGAWEGDEEDEDDSEDGDGEEREEGVDYRILSKSFKPS